MTEGRELAGKVAVVAGGTRGLGRTVALRLAAAGADVVVAARDPGPGDAVVAELEAHGIGAAFVETDLADHESAAALTARVVERFGRLDILVVNGGDGGEDEGRRFVDTEPQTFPGYFTGQLFTRLNAISAALPAMRDQGYGKIVVLTTDAGRVPTTGEALFGAAAAALLFAVRAVGREVAPLGVRLNAVSITVTRGTVTWDRLEGDMLPGDVLPAAFAKIESRSPFGLNGAEDVAAAVHFLASPQSDQISGATISVNGGLSFPG